MTSCACACWTASKSNGAYHTELAYGSRVVAGIEFDQNGKRLAIHAWKQRPGLPVAITLELIRIPIVDVCQIFKPETPGQVRGISWFAPVLLRLVDLDAAHDAQLMSQKVAALLTGYITSPDNGAAGFEGRPEDDGALESGLEPGTLKVLRPRPGHSFLRPGARRTGSHRVFGDHGGRNRGRPWRAPSSN